MSTASTSEFFDPQVLVFNLWTSNSCTSKFELARLNATANQLSFFKIIPRYEKAENEIKKKQLNAQVEQAMLQQHAQCKAEAESKFSKIDEVIAQIQLYQACMDYHISQVS